MNGDADGVLPVTRPNGRKLNRRERRAMSTRDKALDELMFVRYDLTSAALAAIDAEESTDGVTVRGLVMAHLDEALLELEHEGGDVWNYTVVTLGAHPRNPGGISIEVKTREAKP